MPLTLALGRQRQDDLCEFKMQDAFKTSSVYTKKPCLRNTKTKTKQNTKKTAAAAGRGGGEEEKILNSSIWEPRQKDN